jgi:hypothetical protein
LLLPEAIAASNPQPSLRLSASPSHSFIHTAAHAPRVGRHARGHARTASHSLPDTHSSAFLSGSLLDVATRTACRAPRTVTRPHYFAFLFRCDRFGCDNSLDVNSNANSMPGAAHLGPGSMPMRSRSSCVAVLRSCCSVAPAARSRRRVSSIRPAGMPTSAMKLARPASQSVVVVGVWGGAGARESRGRGG